MTIRSLCTTYLIAAVAAAPAGTQQTPTTATVEAVGHKQTTLVQGDPLNVSYIVTGGGEKLSATAFVREGAVEADPKDWHVDAVRFEPKYQIEKRDMRGETKRVHCSLPGRATGEMDPGPHSLFVAVSDPPSGWQITKLGEFTVVRGDRIELPKRTGAPVAAVWRDEVTPAGAASSPERLAELASQAGCTVRFVSSAELADETALNRDAFDVLVMPYGGAVPESAMGNIATFLERAGALLCTGGPALTDPLSGVAETEAARPARMLADMEAADDAARLELEHGPKAEGSIERVAGGASGTGHGLRVHVADLKDWFYVCVPLTDTGGAGDTAIRFWAKGDANTDRLCLELKETDGSRWKYFVKLTEQWQQYTVWMADFASYASPSRGDPGDRFRPENAALLKVGFYRALFDDAQPRTFWIDEVERLAAPERRSAERLSHWADWHVQYAYLKARPPSRQLALFETVRRTEGISRIFAATGQHAVQPDTQVTGTFAGWETVPVTALASDGRWQTGSTPCARHVPLLVGKSADGAPPIVLASALVHYRGPYRGARCAFFNVDSTDLFAPDRPSLERVFVDTVRWLTSTVCVLDAKPRFAADTPDQAWDVRVANLAARESDVELRATSTAGTALGTDSLSLQPGEIRQVTVTEAGEELDPARFGINVCVEQEDRVVDELVAEADALSTLRTAADWLLARQKPEGNYSSFFYADVYGARALVALSNLTGDPKYAESAYRVTDMLVRDQRPDGGWWVGYGPGKECVFVADDGCIALGLVQLAARADETRRRAYLDAARKFIDFRESFRVTDEVAQELEAEHGKDHRGILRGGLGVGYVANDYFAKKPYPQTHRERRQFVWTLHCSLPFLGGLHRLTGDERAGQLAAQDTQWFLDRVAEDQDSVRNAYANEAAVWMLDTLDDPGMKAELTEQLRETFLPHVADPTSEWTTASGGRGALLLPGLVYCSRHLDEGPAAKAALARALWSLCSDTSPLSIQHLVERHPRTTNGEIVMYVCFSAVGLAELLEPRSTMLPTN